ncbi:GNAT family N-acetyltransferase [Vibrio kyushuensis]|uniref:GNAT family N-acetyltransferase n=1 Tax=Vibrio kyushuensis TaxID=2910249 RepID=UPI003D0AE019
MSELPISNKVQPELTIAVLDPIKVPLVTRLYKAHYPSGKAKKDERIITVSNNNTMVGVVRFRNIEQYRLLTGMLIIPEMRDQGVGHQLLDHCQAHELSNRDYCFAYQHLEHFYSHHQFHTIEPNKLPNSLKNLFERYVNSGRSLIPMQFQADN